MALIDIVRPRLGIYYTDPAKDAEISQLIAEAKADLKSSGWPPEELAEGNESQQAVTAICTHCLRAWDEIDDEKARRILVGLQTKAEFRNEAYSDPN